MWSFFSHRQSTPLWSSTQHWNWGGGGRRQLADTMRDHLFRTYRYLIQAWHIVPYKMCDMKNPEHSCSGSLARLGLSFSRQLVLDLPRPSPQLSRRPSQQSLGTECVWKVAARSSRRLDAHEMRGFPYNSYTTIIQQPYNNYTTIPYNNSFRCSFVGKAARQEEWNKNKEYLLYLSHSSRWAAFPAKPQRNELLYGIVV